MGSRPVIAISSPPSAHDLVMAALRRVDGTVSPAGKGALVDLIGELGPFREAHLELVRSVAVPKAFVSRELVCWVNHGKLLQRYLRLTVRLLRLPADDRVAVVAAFIMLGHAIRLMSDSN